MASLIGFFGASSVAASKLRYQDFNSSGTFTPSAALLANGGQCLVILIGGGGSGAAICATTTSGSAHGSASGGDAGQYIEKIVTVSGAVTVTIGAGGTAVTSRYPTGGPAQVRPGNSGSNSTFGALLTALGGAGGGCVGNGGRGGGGKGAGGLGSFNTDTSTTIDARGGRGIDGKAGGGAGSATYGAAHMSATDGGGNGYYSTTTAATAPSGSANTGGGGGACHCIIVEQDVFSGAGGSGWCRVIWSE